MKQTSYFQFVFHFGYDLILYLYFLVLSLLGLRRFLPFLEQGHTKKEYRVFVLGWFCLLLFPLGITHFEIVHLHNTALFPLRALLSLAFLASLLIVFWAWPLTRYILIPLGLVRPAFYGGLLARKTFAFDPKGGAIFTAVWALLRQKQPSSTDQAFIEKQFRQNIPFKGAGLVAYALFLHYQQDQNAVRLLLSCLDTLDSHVFPPKAQQEMVSWLVADACEKQDWVLVKELSRIWKKNSSKKVNFLGWFATQMLSQNTESTKSATPSLFQFHARVFVSRLPKTLSQELQKHLFQKAPIVSHALPEIPATFSNLQKALFLHGYLCKNPMQAVLFFPLFIQAWEDAFLDKALIQLIWQRCFAVELLQGEEILQKFRNQVEEELIQLALNTKVKWMDFPTNSLGTSLKEKIQNQVLSDIELRCNRLKDRTEAKRSLPPLEEWQEWSSLRAEYQEIVKRGGPDIHYLAWSHFHTDVCNFAVWLWNERKERVLANTIFRWLWFEALALQDEQSIDLQTRNVACGWE